VASRWPAFAVAGVLVAGVIAYIVVSRPAPPAATPVPPTSVATPAVTPPAPGAAPPAAPTTSAAPKRSPAPAATPARSAEPVPAPDAPPVAGTLRFTSDVADTSVFIDRQYLGTAPITAPNLAPGPHQLKMVAAGYDSINETIDVEPGPRDYAAKFKEVKLDVRIDVTHKHGVGSCQGTLLATAQGLRYETSNKDDAFSVAFGDLETFEVDYLNKTLKVKIRKGKTFNFTNGDPNADRLYVFHSDVEKPRKRLAGGD